MSNFGLVESKVKKIVKYVLLSVLAAVLVYISLRKVGWTDFVKDLGETRWGLVLLSFIPAVAALIFRVARWREMLRQLDPDQKFLKVWDANSVGTIANTVLPGSGEFVRCGGVTSGKASYEKVLGTAVMERMWDLAAIGVLVVTVLALKWDVFGPFFVNYIVTPLSGRLVWIGLALSCIAAGVSFIGLCFARSGKNAFCAKVAGVFIGIWQGFLSFLKMDRKLLFALYTILIWTMYILMCWCCVKAVPALSGLTFLDAMVFSSVGNFASVIPVPGGIGAYHYLIATCVTALYGGTWEVGILFATLCHESHAILVVVIGAISYLHIVFSRKK